MKPVMRIILISLIFGQLVCANDKESAEMLLKNKLDGVLGILQEKDIEELDKKKRITTLVEPIFDFPLMAKLTLGKKHWPNLSDDHKTKFIKLFTHRLKVSYLEKMMLYTDEKIDYKETIQKGKKVHITTLLVSNDNQLSMLYKMYTSKKGWLIYDIEIQGVSIITTYKSQFDQILSKGDIKDLLAELRKKAKPTQ